VIASVSVCGRFAATWRAFRDAGVYVDTDPQLGYRMICFRPETDAV
jgi:hypothetical protein